MIRPRKRSNSRPLPSRERDAEPGRQQLLLGVARRARGHQDPVPARRRVADPELAQRALVEAAAEQVLARPRRLAALPQHAHVVRGGALQQGEQPVAAHALRGVARVLALALELHPGALGEPLQRRAEVQALRLHREREDVAAGPAAEAVVELLDGIDPERRGALLVERAQALEPVRAGALELRPRTDELREVDRVADLLPGLLRVAAIEMAGEALRDEALGPGADREAVGHPRQVVDHPVGLRGAGDALGHLLRALDVEVEQPAQHPLDLRVLGPGDRPEVDVLEHERAQPQHRRADHGPLHDVPGRLGVLHEVVHEPVDPPRARVAEHRDLLGREVRHGEHARPHRVVDVVVDVGDPVDQPHDLALERRRLPRPARVAQDPVAHRLGQVEVLQHVHHPQRVLVVAEADAEALAPAGVQHALADVPERRVPDVVPEADRLHEVLVERQRPRHGARDLRRLQRVGQPRPVVVALRRHEHLRLVLQAPERLGVHDPVAVALERRAQAALGLLARPHGGIRGGRRTARAGTRAARLPF